MVDRRNPIPGVITVILLHSVMNKVNHLQDLLDVSLAYLNRAMSSGGINTLLRIAFISFPSRAHTAKDPVHRVTHPRNLPWLLGIARHRVSNQTCDRGQNPVTVAIRTRHDNLPGMYSDFNETPR